MAMSFGQAAAQAFGITFDTVYVRYDGSNWTAETSQGSTNLTGATDKASALAAAVTWVEGNPNAHAIGSWVGCGSDDNGYTRVVVR